MEAKGIPHRWKDTLEMVTLELIKAIPRVGRNLLSDLSTAHDMYARCLLLLVMVKVFFCICCEIPR